MTDKEIIKALKCCMFKNCTDCPMGKVFCDEAVPMQYALDLINRQQTQLRKEENKNSKLRNERNRYAKEIERLNYYLDCYNYVFGDVKPRIQEIKAEAIKDFVHYFYDECLEYPLEPGDLTILVSRQDFDNLVKYMTEGDNG